MVGAFPRAVAYAARPVDVVVAAGQRPAADRVGGGRRAGVAPNPIPADGRPAACQRR